MRNAASSLDSTIDSCNYFLFHDKKYLEQMIAALLWKLSDNQNPQNNVVNLSVEHSNLEKIVDEFRDNI
jgi:hypothetical protein